jgi:hypothetical protein
VRATLIVPNDYTTRNKQAYLTIHNQTTSSPAFAMADGQEKLREYPELPSKKNVGLTAGGRELVESPLSMTMISDIVGRSTGFC